MSVVATRPASGAPRPASAAAGRLVVVSNRVARPAAANTGGLASALDAALRSRGGLWFGWNGRSEAGTEELSITTEAGVTYATVGISERALRGYYAGFANGVLWPLLHFRPGLVRFRRRDFEQYLAVNRAFAERLAPLLRPTDHVWVHDYHLIPLGRELRRLGFRGPIGFFLHTPFPPCELLGMLPGQRELFEPLCAYDLVGVQTAADAEAVRGCVAQLDVPVSAHPAVAAFPIGIDTAGIERLAAASDSLPAVRALRSSLGDRALVLGVDRLDYSKGQVERLRAYEQLLRAAPDWHGRVVLLQIAPPSRSEVPEYRRLRRELDRMAGHINGEFADPHWVPVRYVHKSYSHDTLVGYYRAARVGLVTPLRDGMNLVAKEYVASQDGDDPGVLVLSRFAGAARELSGALQVNPNDGDAMAEALQRALVMPVAERRARWRDDIATLRGADIDAWRDDFLASLHAAAARRRSLA